MPTCRKCGYWDDTDADFDNSRTICDGCTEKAKVAARAEGYEEYQIGEYTVLEKAVGDSCGDCGSHSIDFIAWKGGKFIETLICANCDSVQAYLYPEDVEPFIR